MGKGNMSELFCILPRQIYKFEESPQKSALRVTSFNSGQSNLIKY